MSEPATEEPTFNVFSTSAIVHLKVFISFPVKSHAQAFVSHAPSLLHTHKHAYISDESLKCTQLVIRGI